MVKFGDSVGYTTSLLLVLVCASCDEDRGLMLSASRVPLPRCGVICGSAGVIDMRRTPPRLKIPLDFRVYSLAIER